ncbi:AAA family ATPase [candidate division WWE3 bacterium]|uniref:DNA 3'-5' helicase n=1 Tax=candidate division WWE3 bacterium TaxID=2053526 RepID=A0A7X9HST2_UNCKA|nr:AAA family ATPase [candidate division WWE3 bacterium]
MNPRVKKQEISHLKSVKTKLRKASKSASESLSVISSENIERLKELREGGTGSFGYEMTDFDVFIDQLQQKNAALNIRDKYRVIEELEFLLKEPYFSRVDLYDGKTKKEDQYYIGKFSYTEDKPIITDWRSKVASVYYRYRYPQKNVFYDTPVGREIKDLKLKRTFEIQDGEFIRYYNNDLQLDESTIVVEKIKKRTGGVLEDIIQTIQESQLDIIELDPRQICIVQGCVGSGKSTVAIHKLAHIFFNYPKVIRPERCLLVAKSQILSGYLSTLFPKLGIFDVSYKTIREVAFNMALREGLGISVDLNDMERKGEFNTSKVKKIQFLIKATQKKYEKKINDIFKDPDLESFASFKYSYDETPYENIFDILEDVIEELNVQKDLLRKNPDSPRTWFYKENIIALRKILRLANKIKNEIRNDTLRKFVKNLEINTSKKLNYCETLVYLYVYSELVGIRKMKKFEYCVVDEAQDFSALEYLFLSKIVLRGRFALFGDLNQSLEPGGIEDWKVIPEIIKEAKNASKFELNKNYRSTKQIISLANKILKPYTKDYLPKSINRVGDDPVIELFRTSEDLLAKFEIDIKKDLKEVNKSIGIICFNDYLDKAQEILFSIKEAKKKIIKLQSNEKTWYTSKGIYLMSEKDCKGLEFSKVYVLGLNLKKIKSFSEAREAFVSATRAMNELYIYGVK